MSEGLRMFAWPSDQYITGINAAVYPNGINGEDIVMDGELAHEDLTYPVDPITGRPIQATLSAMKLEGIYLIGVTPRKTPTDGDPAVSFTVDLGTDGSSYVLEDLRRNDPLWTLSINGSTATISHPQLEESTVLRLIPQ